MDRIRTLVVDEHRVFAESLATALSAEPDVSAVAAGGTRAAGRLLGRARASGEPFHVLLADAGLLPDATAPAVNAAAKVPVTATAVAVTQDAPTGTADRAASAGAPPADEPDTSLLTHPGLRLVVLAAQDDAGTAARLLSAGALGWVAKDSSLARLTHVLRGVLRDETHLPPALLTGVLREMTRERQGRGEYQRLADALTPRELEVLRCMLAGMGRKAVAERLYLSPHTVRTHMQNVLGKLGVHSTLAAVAVARRAGVPPAEG